MTADGWPEQAGTGDWEPLLKPGKGGFVLVLLSLSWWKKAAEGADMGWDSAVNDVLWVLHAILLANTPESIAGENDAPPAAAKRKTRDGTAPASGLRASKRVKKHQ